MVCTESELLTDPSIEMLELVQCVYDANDRLRRFICEINVRTIGGGMFFLDHHCLRFCFLLHSMTCC
jgi:hypothetical protein